MRRLALALLFAALPALAQRGEPQRPQLDPAQAATQRIADYLAQGPSPWLPPDGVEAGAPADFVVAADGSGTHRTLQAAIDALPARAEGGRRRVIQLKPGVYREIVCAKDKVPFTLSGSIGDPAAVTLVEGRYNALPQRAGIEAANPCDPQPQAASHGTPGSASVALFGDDIHVAWLTIANDAMDRVRAGAGYPAGAGESGGAQAVALMTRGDRILLHHVRLLGHQDTLMVRAEPGRAARVLVRQSLIAGDVDFIFGDATLVVHDSTILSRGGRRTPGHGGHVLAPSTAAAQRLGFLVSASRLLAEPGVAPGSVSLGRAWDSGVARGAWVPGVSPNGQALVRDSLMGAHIAAWADSTSRRPSGAGGEQAHRMAEFGNLRFESDPAREVLGASDGWGAAGGGTTGGAAALPADVSTVHNRAELAAALAPHARPRIVKVVGRIDLSVDETGRALAEADYRDPEFDWDAFERAYDPAVWGKRAPAGALEQARQRSARNQAARVVLRVPSHTTLIGVGVGAGAGIANGMLLLERVANVIVRNLHFSDAYDFFPAWDPNDNAGGEWNSEYDNLSLREATRVWVDHCSFDDGERPDAAARTRLGRPMQHHDGLLDITRQSDFVTVSWNVLRDHDKTTLVGSSDNQRADAGRLRVSFHHNLWERVKERAPRVRFGRVHAYNNLYLQALGYSLGVGFESRLLSENNAWEGELPATRLVRLFKGSRFADRGSLLNGKPVDLLAALREAYPGTEIAADVGWSPALPAWLDPAAEVGARVRAGAGAGRLP